MDTSDLSDFSSILHAAEQLVGCAEGTINLPRVERSLGQVLEASQELHSKLAQEGTQDVQAHLLLGSKGVDLTEISQKLHSLSAQRTLEPLDPVADTDIQSFLRNEKENAILSVIEEVHRNSFKDVEKSRWDHVVNEWRQEKSKLMGALIGPSQNWLDLNKSIARHTIVPDTTPTSGQRSNLDNKEMAYAKEITDYNKLVVQGAMRPNLVQKFTLLARKFSDSRVANLWEILRYITDCPPLPRDEDSLKSRSGYENAIVKQSKKYLEDRYVSYMNSCVAQNMASAKRGGKPGTYNLVRAFVSLRMQAEAGNAQGLQDGEVDGRPLWPMVYYCLRAGDLQAAQQCIQNSGPGNEEFIQVLAERIRKPDHKISSALENAIRLHYRRHIRNASDPYKRVAYCVVGGCDVVEEHSQVSRTADDFLWLKLSFINLSDGQGGCITFSDLQKTILDDFGETYYNAAEHPLLYAQVLLLSGQLEAAIEFLSRSNRLRCHAVHAALALHELHMLACPRNVQAPLLSTDIGDPVPTRRLNIARLVMLYVKKFEMSDPSEAMQYFFFLRNLHHPSGDDLFTICVADLAIEIRDYALIFGKMQPNGQRSRGIIDQFLTTQINAQDICKCVGEQLVKKGLLEDAITVYELAENYNKVLSLYCTLLSQIAHRQSQSGSLRNRLQTGATEFRAKIENSQIVCDSNKLASFNHLLQIMNFFDAYHSGQQLSAMEILRSSGILPLTLTEVDACVQLFKELSAEVCRIVPDLLLSAMDIVYTQYISLKKDSKGALDKTNKDKQLDYYRDQAKALTNFAGTVPYRMPGDTNQRLVQLEISMY
uniref:Nuclear pore protein n=1 Tax=Xenopsylla cheopis TaxID=163159 RepID=A0A6M2DPY4_XENCH